ncbi:MAG TPA: efflux RND transporter periplasmic adaptor subunit [Bacteroidales bacterium]|nr:efflux RND transporter periplasmic adaptor subunit [Bacteroidales bacterium]
MDGMDRKIEKKHKWTKKYTWITAISAVFLFAAYNIVFGDKSSKLNVETEKLAIEDVKSDIFQDYIAVIGTVEPIRTIYIDAMEGGRVEDIYLEEGTMVKKGDLIMRLSNSNLLLDILNREAGLAEQENLLRSNRLAMEQNKLDLESKLLELNYNMKKFERAYKSNEILIKDNLISREDYERAKEEYEYSLTKKTLLLKTQKQDSAFRSVAIKQLESSVGRMQENIVLIKEKFQSLNVTAPVDGQLAIIMPEIGESMGSGQRLAQINVLDAYKMKVDIDEHYIARIIKNLKGDFEFDSKNYNLKLTKIYPEVKNGRFSVDMEFTGQTPEQIRIGQTARIRLELGESKQAILIPRGGFYQSTGGQWVYVVSKDEKVATRRTIHIGRQNPKYYEVLDGLEAGEKVIVSSYETYGDADKLVLKHEK